MIVPKTDEPSQPLPLTISPPILNFCPLSLRLLSPLTLHNPNDRPLPYKIRSTQAKLISIKSAVGEIGPKQTINLEVKMLEMPDRKKIKVQVVWGDNKRVIINLEAIGKDDAFMNDTTAQLNKHTSIEQKTPLGVNQISISCLPSPNNIDATPIGPPTAQQITSVDYISSASSIAFRTELGKDYQNREPTKLVRNTSQETLDEQIEHNDAAANSKVNSKVQSKDPIIEGDTSHPKTPFPTGVSPPVPIRELSEAEDEGYNEQLGESLKKEKEKLEREISELTAANSSLKDKTSKMRGQGAKMIIVMLIAMVIGSLIGMFLFNGTSTWDPNQFSKRIPEQLTNKFVSKKIKLQTIDLCQKLF